jgi:Zn-finger nucleic acid-binding protein
MLCPIDQTTLVISERQGIEIDYCPKCRGVWLDRGELDKIIERSEQQVTTSQAPVSQARDTRDSDSGFGKIREVFQDRDRDRDRDDDEYTYDKHGRRKKKRGGFLDDLFDF